jgi:hypothetical protein
MSYIKDKLSDNKVAAEQRPDKSALKQLRSAYKSSKKEEKRLRKVDNMLSAIFNRLNTDLDESVLALEKFDGHLSQWVGGANTAHGLLKNGFGLAAKNIGELTPEQIENNKAYQTYKQTMSAEGYDVEITHTEASRNLSANKFGTTISTSLGATCLMSGFPPIQAIGGVVFGAAAIYNIASSNWRAAHFGLKLKEKQPIALLEYKPVQSDVANLLAQIDEQKVKTRQPIIK